MLDRRIGGGVASSQLVSQGGPQGGPQVAIRGHLGIIWEASGIHLEPSGTHLEASGRPLGDIGEASGRHLGSLWEASEKHLESIWEAWAPKVPRRLSEGSQAQKSVTHLS